MFICVPRVRPPLLSVLAGADSIIATAAVPASAIIASDAGRFVDRFTLARRPLTCPAGTQAGPAAVDFPLGFYAPALSLAAPRSAFVARGHGGRSAPLHDA